MKMNYLKLTAVLLILASLIIFTYHDIKPMTVVKVEKVEIPKPEIIVPPPKLTARVGIPESSSYHGHYMASGKIEKFENGKLVYKIKIHRVIETMTEKFFEFYYCISYLDGSEWKYKYPSNWIIKYNVDPGDVITLTIDLPETTKKIIFYLYTVDYNKVILDDVDLYPKPEGRIDIYDSKYLTYKFFEDNVKIFWNKRFMYIAVAINWFPYFVFEYEDTYTSAKSYVECGIKKIEIYLNNKLYKSETFDKTESTWSTKIVFPSDGIYNLKIKVIGYGWDYEDTKSWSVFSLTAVSSQLIPLPVSNYEFWRVLIYVLGVVGVLTTLRREKVGLAIGLITLALAVLLCM